MLLFLLMHTLISGEQEFASDELTGGMVDFIRVREDEITQLKDRTPPQEPEPPDEPPPPPQLHVTERSTEAPAAVLDIEVPLVSVPVSTGTGPFIGQWSPGDAASEGDVLPIVRIDPQWPREALIEGTEGWVQVEFTILPDGTVEDFRIVSVSRTGIGFERATEEAVRQWRYEPATKNGVKVRTWVAVRVPFTLR